MEARDAMAGNEPIEAKEAIARAKRYVAEYFSGEGITNVGFEEIENDGLDWEVTIGFSRPWDSVRDAQSIITGIPTLQRSYKKVLINRSNGELVKILNR